MDYILVPGNGGKIAVYEAWESTFDSRSVDYASSKSYEEFYDAFLEVIESKVKIEDMRITRTGLELEIVSIDTKSTQCTSKTVSIHCVKQLLCDEAFMNLLKKIEQEYAKVKSETLKNIKDEKEKIEDTLIDDTLAKTLILDFFTSGKLEEEVDRAYFLDFREYVLNNKDKVISIFKDIHRLKYFPFPNCYRYFSHTLIFIFKCIFYWFIGTGTVFLIIEVLASLFEHHSIDFLVRLNSLVVSLLGCSAASLLVVLKRWDNIPLNMLYEKIYGDLVKETERVCENSKKLETPVLEKTAPQDKFLEYIKRDAMYMSRHPEFDFSAEATAMKELTLDYVRARNEEYSGGALVDRFKYLMSLTELEVAVYSKVDGNGTKANIISHLGEEALEERLEFLGLPSTVTFEDRNLQDIFDNIKRVFRTPYVGCEVQILKLFKVAQEYVEDVKRDREPKGYGASRATSLLIKKLSSIEAEINENTNASIDADALNRQLSSIEEYINSIGSGSQEIGGEQQTTMGM